MINKKEIKQLASLIKKIDNPHEGLPQPIFEALIKIIPFIACELVVVGKKGLLLTWREDKWWRGWHFPGGLLRYQENFEERIEKIAWKELGVNITNCKFLLVKDCPFSNRGHFISLVFLCKTSMTPKFGKFFKKMPKNIIEDHKEMWERVHLHTK